MSVLKLKDCEINYKTHGSGQAIVFLHGLSDDLNYWDKLAKLFENDYYIILIDLRGHGKSVYKKGSINYSNFNNDIYQLLKFLGVKHAIFIGFSLGGTISLNFALKYPKMVDKLVLMSTFGKVSDDLKKVHFNIYNQLENSLGDFYDTMIPLVLPEDNILNNKDMITKGRSYCFKKDADAIKETMRQYLELDIEDSLCNIKQPTLIIGGSDDKYLSPYKLMIRLFEEIDNSYIVFLHNTKHNILIPRNINKVYFLIKNFLLK